jgi:hypothetical protein
MNVKSFRPDASSPPKGQIDHVGFGRARSRTRM